MIENKLIHFIGFSLFLIIPLSIFTPSNIVTIFLLIALFSLKSIKNKKILNKKIIIALLIIHIISTFSVFWSIVPKETFILSLKLIILSSSGLIILKKFLSIEKKHKEIIKKYFLYGFILGLVILGIEIISNASILSFIKQSQQPLNKFNKIATIMTIMIWPITKNLINKNYKLTSAIIVIVTFVIISQLESAAAIIAFIIGSVVFIISYISPNKTALFLIFFIFGSFILSPFTIPPISKNQYVKEYVSYLPSSWLHRFVIWKMIGLKIINNPLLGWGLNSSKSDFFSKEYTCWLEKSLNNNSSNLKCANILPLHPHNLALQFWLELGFLGVIIMSYLISLIPMFILNIKNRFEKMAALASFSSAIFIAGVSYGIWQSWWVSALWLAIIINIIHINKPLNKE